MPDVLSDASIRTDGDADSRIVDEWVERLSAAVAERDLVAVEALFDPEATARDLLAFSWDFRNAVGPREVAELLAGPGARASVEMETESGVAPIFDEQQGRATAESFLRFRTPEGAGEGYLKLIADGSGEYRAIALTLCLTGLDSHPERVGERRPAGRVHGPIVDRLSWREALDADFEQADPEVLIIGAGHNGLMLAARLRALGISALIVDRNERVGDNWRNRYSSLALHTPLPTDNLPYLPYPPTWTKFPPKDKFADFLECYATLLDLCVWTSSQVENIRFDGETDRWQLDVVRRDGSRRTLTPSHLVFATGMNGDPSVPELPGRDDYRGTVIHAVDYRGYADWIGKKVVVVGSGVSGHDLAQDLVEHGVDVTMIQRSGTLVMNTSTFHTVMHANFIGGKYNTEQADLVNASVPFGALPSHGAEQLAMAKVLDRDLLDSLERAGFELSDGPNGQGVLGLIFGLNGTGYYFNAGASELIVDGSIKLEHGSVTGFTPKGVALEDGRTIDADLVILATGYQAATARVRELLGDGAADVLGDFADVGEDREYGRLWRRSGLDRLWFAISLGIDAGRFYSRLLALQIAAIEAGDMTVSASNDIANGAEASRQVVG